MTWNYSPSFPNNAWILHRLIVDLVLQVEITYTDGTKSRLFGGAMANDEPWPWDNTKTVNEIIDNPITSSIAPDYFTTAMKLALPGTYPYPDQPIHSPITSLVGNNITLPWKVIKYDSTKVSNIKVTVTVHENRPTRYQIKYLVCQGLNINRQTNTFGHNTVTGAYRTIAGGPWGRRVVFNITPQNIADAYPYNYGFEIWGELVQDDPITAIGTPARSIWYLGDGKTPSGVVKSYDWSDDGGSTWYQGNSGTYIETAPDATLKVRDADTLDLLDDIPAEPYPTTTTAEPEFPEQPITIVYKLLDGVSSIVDDDSNTFTTVNESTDLVVNDLSYSFTITPIVGETISKITVTKVGGSTDTYLDGSLTLALSNLIGGSTYEIRIYGGVNPTTTVRIATTKFGYNYYNSALQATGGGVSDVATVGSVDKFGGTDFANTPILQDLTWTVTPDAGWYIDGVEPSYGIDALDTATEKYGFTRTIQAVDVASFLLGVIFREIVPFTVSFSNTLLSASQGTVSIDQLNGTDYTMSTTSTLQVTNIPPDPITVTVTPGNASSMIQSISIGGVSQTLTVSEKISGKVISFTPTANMSVAVVFSTRIRTLSWTQDNNSLTTTALSLDGAVQNSGLSGSISVDYGEDVPYVVTPTLGYYVKTVTVDGISTTYDETTGNTPISGTISITNSHSISVVLDIIQIALTVVSADSGVTVVALGQTLKADSAIFTLPYGSDVDITSTPVVGKQIHRVVSGSAEVLLNQFEKTQGIVDPVYVIEDTTYIVSSEATATNVLNIVFVEGSDLGTVVTMAKTFKTSGTLKAAIGYSPSVVITPLAGKVLTRIKVNGVESSVSTAQRSSGKTITIPPMYADATVEVWFASSDTVALVYGGCHGVTTVTHKGSDTTQVDTYENYNTNVSDSLRISAVPDPGYSIAKFVVNGVALLLTDANRVNGKAVTIERSEVDVVAVVTYEDASSLPTVPALVYSDMTLSFSIPTGGVVAATDKDGKLVEVTNGMSLAGYYPGQQVIVSAVPTSGMWVTGLDFSGDASSTITVPVNANPVGYTTKFTAVAGNVLTTISFQAAGSAPATLEKSVAVIPGAGSSIAYKGTTSTNNYTVERSAGSLAGTATFTSITKKFKTIELWLLTEAGLSVASTKTSASTLGEVDTLYVDNIANQGFLVGATKVFGVGDLIKVTSEGTGLVEVNDAGTASNNSIPVYLGPTEKVQLRVTPLAGSTLESLKVITKDVVTYTQALTDTEKAIGLKVTLDATANSEVVAVFKADDEVVITPTSEVKPPLLLGTCSSDGDIDVTINGVTKTILGPGTKNLRTLFGTIADGTVILVTPKPDSGFSKTAYAIDPFVTVTPLGTTQYVYNAVVEPSLVKVDFPVIVPQEYTIEYTIETGGAIDVEGSTYTGLDTHSETYVEGTNASFDVSSITSGYEIDSIEYWPKADPADVNELTVANTTGSNSYPDFLTSLSEDWAVRVYIFSIPIPPPAPGKINLEVRAEGLGSVEVTVDSVVLGTVAANTNEVYEVIENAAVSLVSTPDSGKEVVSLTLVDDAYTAYPITSPATNPQTAAFSAGSVDKQFTAVFKQNVSAITLSLQVISEGSATMGVVTVGADDTQVIPLTDESPLVVTTSANFPCWELVSVTQDGVELQAPYTADIESLVLNEQSSSLVVAKYERKRFLMPFTNGEGGSVVVSTPSGGPTTVASGESVTIEVLCGEDVTYTITPDKNHKVDKINEEDTEDLTKTFTPDGTEDLKVEYTQADITITAEIKGATETITVNGTVLNSDESVDVPYNSTITVTVTNASGDLSTLSYSNFDEANLTTVEKTTAGPHTYIATKSHTIKARYVATATFSATWVDAGPNTGDTQSITGTMTLPEGVSQVRMDVVSVDPDTHEKIKIDYTLSNGKAKFGKYSENVREKGEFTAGSYTLTLVDVPDNATFAVSAQLVINGDKQDYPEVYIVIPPRSPLT